MKVSKQDEYGLRILLRIAKADVQHGITLSYLSEVEKMSIPYAGKITRQLKMAGFIDSNRGQKGGYYLAQPSYDIIIKDVIAALGGLNLAKEKCDEEGGQFKFCTNSIDCSMKSLWTIVQYTLDKVLESITLQDLMADDSESKTILEKIMNSHKYSEAFV